ncbi:hypothetical protein Ae201684P_007256 [Aphanomyces euteiches]|nr:hypothetical protein Ae201684P_007256 [Aphanomyces euteiches]
MASTLDVSYNQGGLPWMEEITWKFMLPNLVRLIYRGNNLTTLRFTSRNLPTNGHPFSALDVSGNAKLTFVFEKQSQYTFLKKHLTFTTDKLDSSLVHQECRSIYIMLGQLRSVPVEYLPQGGVQYDNSSVTDFDVCVQPFNADVDPTDGALEPLLIALSVVGSGILVLFLVLRFGLKPNHDHYVKENDPREISSA